MRTAAHSCLITRKSLGGARTTAATTELSVSATEDEVSDTSEAAADAAPLCPPDELRQSRLHFLAFAPPCFSFSAAGLSPTSVLIHFPDGPMDRCPATPTTKTARFFFPPNALSLVFSGTKERAALLPRRWRNGGTAKREDLTYWPLCSHELRGTRGAVRAFEI